MHVLLAGAEDNSSALQAFIASRGHQVRLCAVDAVIEEYLEDRTDLVLLDVSSEAGMEAMRQLQLEDPSALLVGVSGSPSVEEAVAAVQSSAKDYLELPAEEGRLSILLEHAILDWRKRAQLNYLRSWDSEGAQIGRLVGSCAAMRDVFDSIMRLARRTVSAGAPTILIQGETGTGKGCIARAIHYNRGRSEDDVSK